MEDCVAKYVPRGGTVLDVGANIGDVTEWLSKCVGPEGTVYAIEPGPNFYGLLKVRSESFGNVRTFPIAFAEKCSQRPVFFYRHYTLLDLDFKDPRYQNPNYHPWQPRELKRDFFATFCTLDGFREKELPSRKIDFIKIDVDGYELRVLKGAMKTLEVDHPVLYVEVTRTNMAQIWETPEELCDLLRLIGYRAAYFTGQEFTPISWEDVPKILPTGDIGADLLCT